MMKMETPEILNCKREELKLSKVDIKQSDSQNSSHVYKNASFDEQTFTESHTSASRPSLKFQIEKVKAHFEKIDKQTSDFQKMTHVSCPKGCGHCCSNPNVQATILEMLPLAFELYTDSKYNDVVDKIFTSSQHNSSCFFFNPKKHTYSHAQLESEEHVPFLKDPQSLGSCGVYKHRPSLCRLFAYAGRLNKEEKKEWSLCWVYKKEYSNEFLNSISEKITDGKIELPLFQEHFMALQQIDPSVIGKELYSINLALKKALEKIHFYLMNENEEDSKI